MPFLFIFQKCFDNSVEFALLSYLNEITVFVKSVFKYILCKTVLIDSVTGGILFEIALIYYSSLSKQSF